MWKVKLQKKQQAESTQRSEIKGQNKRWKTQEEKEKEKRIAEMKGTVHPPLRLCNCWHYCCPSKPFQKELGPTNSE